jgi:hypothetical protein
VVFVLVRGVWLSELSISPSNTVLGGCL